jgi:hypothetical protein
MFVILLTDKATSLAGIFPIDVASSLSQIYFKSKLADPFPTESHHEFSLAL